MTTRDVSTRVLVARRTGDQLTVLGAGIAVDPEVVLVPLAMSGPLRPRAGVVVLPDERTPAFEAVPVLRVLRSEPGTGDVLGLELAGQLAAHEDPPAEGVDEWLRQRLSGQQPQSPQAPDEGAMVAVVARAKKKKRRSSNPICVLFPRLCS